MTAFASTAAQFYWLRVLTGIGIGALFPIAYSLVADLLFWLSSILGTLVGGMVGSALYRRSPVGLWAGGWRGFVEWGRL